jgi:hypothetical protein
MYICVCCDYETANKGAYMQHKRSKRHVLNENRNKLSTIDEDENQNDLNINEKKLYCCDKCAKVYKTEKSFIEHHKICLGIKSLQCPKCMRTFQHFQNKSRHILNNKCKPKTVCEKEQPQHSNCGTNVNNSNNNMTNSQINNNITNIQNMNLIRNYGQERLDYISDDVFVNNILKSTTDYIIPKYIQYKHFDEKFPENHNIKYCNKQFLLKENDIWNVKHKDELGDTLYYRNTWEISERIWRNKQKLQAYFPDEDQLHEIQKHVSVVELKNSKKNKPITKNIINTVKIFSSQCKS